MNYECTTLEHRVWTTIQLGVWLVILFLQVTLTSRLTTRPQDVQDEVRLTRALLFDRLDVIQGQVVESRAHISLIEQKLNDP